MTNILDNNKIYGLNSKLENLRFKAEENFNYAWTNDVFKNLRGINDIQGLSLEIFFGELDKYLDSIKRSDLEDYDIIIPVNIEFGKVMLHKSITFQKDAQVFLENYNFFKNNYLQIFKDYRDKEIYLNKNSINLLENLNYKKCSYFIIKLKARSLYYAKQKGLNIVHINLGILNFTKYSRIRFLEFHMDDLISTNITDINTPLMFIFNKNSFDTIFFFTYENFRSFQVFKANRVNYYNEIIKVIENIKNKRFKILIAEAFKLYYLALSNTEISDSFLNFWNIIEILLLKRAEIKAEIIKDRLKSLFSFDFKKDFDEMIDLVYSKRNLLVHEALNTIYEADRQFVKSTSETIIRFFLNISQKIDDVGMLEFLYDNMNKPEHILTKESDILNLIKDIKFKDL